MGVLRVSTKPKQWFWLGDSQVMVDVRVDTRGHTPRCRLEWYFDAPREIDISRNEERTAKEHEHD